MTSHRFIALACLTGLSFATLAYAGTAPKLDAYAEKGRNASKAMGGALQTKLKEAISAGGPVAAVEVCKTIAPAIAGEKSKEAQMTIRRTALKVRNPANAPDDMEKRVLADFAAKLSAGTDPAAVEHVEEVMDGETTRVRYFKAIPMAKEPCLACHGSELSPELKTAINALYPADQATGFKEGELRGMFSITMDK